MIKKMLKNKVFVVCFLLFIVIIVLSVIGPWLAPQDPLEINSNKVLQPGDSENILGTDEFGRDIFSRLLLGIRPTITVALGATFIAFFFGSLLGMIAGYLRALPEKLIMRGADIILSFPPILLALLVVGFWGGGVKNLIIIIGIVYIPYFARLAYSSTIQVKGLEYVQSEILLGASHVRVLLKVIFPNILSPLIIQCSLTMAAAILLESGLSFLGLGIIPPDPSWGQMIGEARGYIFSYPMYVIWPSLLLGLTILSINLLGDSLRDILDPKLKIK
ncbi:ABC transporter permease [Pseudogracilibacillus sp. SO30301A]|uniref:ABC transporter permease n=1 Tax=Pseudogracilibacillus sp. SO30301A TaxID=3098291 RepID=UPI00300DFC3D